ncbi:acyl carrier protein [Nocardia sp. NPDC004654]|uniref:acyl carrier protein n=1 Tax=Nocardia sp. NPDC004654 TaxID=3154776 RepID=UPI0033B8FB80
MPSPTSREEIIAELARITEEGTGAELSAATMLRSVVDHLDTDPLCLVEAVVQTRRGNRVKIPEKDLTISRNLHNGVNNRRLALENTELADQLKAKFEAATSDAKDQ